MDEPERPCPGCGGFSMFIQMAVAYRELFKTLQADNAEAIKNSNRPDLNVHFRQRLNIYIDICNRIEKEFSRL